MSTRAAAEIAADCLALAGHDAGAAIWLAVELANSAGLSGRRMRRMFDALIEEITDELDDEAALFRASAYEALPVSATTTVERAEIDANAWRAYDDYCQMLIADMESAAIDHAYDAARDARIMGDA